MDNGIEQVTSGFFEAKFAFIQSWLTDRQRIRRLKAMLRDRRFPKGFRSIEQLRDGIGTDDETTKRLLVAIGARKSETSNEWTLQQEVLR